jgi:arylsulfatase A
MSRRDFLGATAAGVAGLAIGPVWAQAQPVSRPPNIVLIVTDDQGYADFGFTSGGPVRTPHLDRLAAQSVRCRRFYVTPNCSPTRSSLLTGRYTTRTGVYSYIPAGSPMHLRRQEVTLATLLKQRGYATCHLGKWHLGGNLIGGDIPIPRDHGFDHSYGTPENARPDNHNPLNFVRNGETLGPVEGYGCELVTDEAIRWLTGHRKQKHDQPFFLYAAYQEPHPSGLAAPRELIQSYRDANLGGDARLTERLRRHAATVTLMDQAIGRLLKHLDDSDLARDTLVVFLSDNGSMFESRNAPWRGMKSEVREGGIRVPSLWRWPGKLREDVVNDDLLSVTDILPTLCAVAGAQVPKDRIIDGVDVVKALKGEAWERPDPLYSFFYRTDPAGALHDGDWKLLVYFEQPARPFDHAFTQPGMNAIRNAKPIRFELINLRDDPTEQHDLSGREPQRARRMAEQFVRIHDQAVTEGPQWQWGRGRPAVRPEPE